MQTQQISASSLAHSLSHLSPVLQALQQPRPSSKQRFVAELSQCLFDFVIQLLPTQEEMAVKEDVRKLLERLIRTIEPDSRLLSFGSTANGFSLRNSDMDLCCLIDSEDKLSAADLVTMLGDLLERETKFHVKPLPHARIPIVKLTLDPSPGLPHGIACDIGFENRLALENTRLLMCYAMIDPTRVRTMVLFLKVWSKRRKINSPYKGTLSSYGYVLLVIYFLVHVKNPPVLPNLQQMPPLRPITTEETHLNGHNIWFFDDIDLLRQRWRSENTESVAELLIDFFRYYARDFQYNTGVASIRAGLLKKESKGWQVDQYSSNRYDSARERNRLCIEDPFEMDYNVARCVTKDGLYTIRGEFMRASRVLAVRPERAIVAIAELCEERKDEELIHAPVTSARPSPIPPQTPYTVGSNLRPKGGLPERLSPPTQFFEPDARPETQAPRPLLHHQAPPPPDHMAAKRSKWTSPPPPDAPSMDHTLFESQLDKGLELATAPSEAREPEGSYNSGTNSDVFTDGDHSDTAESDDISSVRSYTEGTSIVNPGLVRRPSWHLPLAARIPQFPDNGGGVPVASASRSSLSSRGRIPRVDRAEPSPNAFRNLPEFVPTGRTEFSRRQPHTGPQRSFKNGNQSWSPHLTSNGSHPPSPESPMESRYNEASTVFYQTANTRSPRPNIVYPVPGSQSPYLSQYHSQQHSPISPASQNVPFHQPFHGHQIQVPADILPSNLPPALSSLNPRNNMSGRSSTGPETPTPGPPYSHSHSNSTTTITAPTPPPHTTKFAAQPQPVYSRSPLILSQHNQTLSPQLVPNANATNLHPLGDSPDRLSTGQSPSNGSTSPNRSSAGNSSGSSPTPSSTGYSTSISRSPSPHSPTSDLVSPPPTAMPLGLTTAKVAVEVDVDPTGFATSFSALTVRDEEEHVPSHLAASREFLIDLKQQHHREIEGGRSLS
ncbi:hypothetical protein FA15DRAFT_591711 [Coprinopsis marcescibilis]|uniref:polynucleotide adenylyltransferase n=1 Tax=Coprinopsis marcescibilis TaxID=230819 RepID=A0A5C3KWY6_COPMA|nr:hypothetical protein FA15DRAFT_591711 [Coprinopsis marcescibilis]